MKHFESSFRGVNGYELYYQSWSSAAATAPTSCVIIVHGFGEHSGRYMNLVNELVQHDTKVFAYDQRGHGRSPGQRGHIDSHTELRGDLKAFVDLVKRTNLHCTTFLYGHSMGALVVLDQLLTIKPDVQGTIVSGTPLLPIGVGKPYQLPLARIVSKVLPRYSAKVDLDNSAISRDPAVVADKLIDPYVHDVMTANFAVEQAHTIDRIKRDAGKLNRAMLLVHGEADRLSSAKGTIWLYKAIEALDKQIIIYQGGYHEPHNDIIRDQVVEDMRLWISNHMPTT